MGLTFNGQTYKKSFIPFMTDKSTDTSVEYGLGFTGDNYATTTVATGSPRTIQEITIPKYYYTNTDWLRDIGYSSFIDSIIGAKKTAQVLIVPHINPRIVPDADAKKYIQGWYLLAQFYQAKNPSDDFCETVYNALAQLGTVLPIPPEYLSNLTFRDTVSEVPIDAANVGTLWKTVKRCFLYSTDPTSTNEYPVTFYVPINDPAEYNVSDNLLSYSDVYVAGYHFKVRCPLQSVYIKAQKDESIINFSLDPDYRFWLALNALPMKLVNTKTVGDNTTSGSSTLSNFGYSFKPTANYNIIGWDAKDGDNIVGKNDSEITFTKKDSLGVSPNGKIAVNASPNIYNAVGKQTDNTIGVLPAGANLNNIGTSDITLSSFSASQSGSKADHRYYPLGKYHLLDGSEYWWHAGNDSAWVKTSGFRFINTYTLDGVVLLQVGYSSLTTTSYHGGAREWRYAYPTLNTDNTYSFYWSDWMDGEYY